MKRQASLFLFLAILGALAFFSLSRVQFSANLYELLPRDLVEVRGMDWLNRYFSRDGQLIVTVTSPDPSETEKASRSLAAEFRRNTDLISTVHEELPLDQLALEGGSLIAWLWLNAPPEDVSTLAERLGPDTSRETVEEAMASIEDGLFDAGILVRSYDPLGLARLPDSIRKNDASAADAMVSGDGTLRLFYVKGAGVDFADYRAAAVWLKEVKALVARWRSENGISESTRVGLTGTPAFMAEVGTEMEKDMTLSVIATMTLISLLFWIMHRQSQPLGWLITALCLVLILTLNAGGILFGNLSVMSAGFAAILLGLAVDYGIVLYREALIETPTVRDLRRRVGPAIVWAALTTAVVFLSLNLSSLPGIAQIGTLVAIGIGIGAVVMLGGFAPIAVRFAGDLPSGRTGKNRTGERPRGRTRALIIAGAIPLLALLSIPVRDLPRLEAEFHPFRIRSSPSMKAWQEMEKALRGSESSTPVVVTADSAEELLHRLEALAGRLELERKSGDIRDFILPFGIIPDPKNQAANRAPLLQAVARKGELLSEIDAAGFSEDGKALTRDVLDSWERSLQAGESAPFARPRGELAEWTVSRLFQERDGRFAALGSVKPARSDDHSWIRRVCDEHSAAANLGSLGLALNERIGRDVKRVFLPMIGLLALMLAIVFRSWRDWVLSIAGGMVAASALLLVIYWTPLKLNSFNVCGLPLLFGTGIDFLIHMIFALRRAGGSIPEVRFGIARALFFCGTSSAIGFGSLGLSSAYGLASLGILCAVGILINMIVAVWLLPHWYGVIHRRT